MVTLNRVHGGSLVAGLNDAFDNMEKASIKQFGLDREKKDIDLLRQAQGLAPLTPPVQANNGNKKQRGFIRSISPQIADHIDGLNESRDVNGIDEVRNTAQMTIATARKILAAKTPAAKQKILLENAQKARKEGRDNTKMLKSAGMSPAQIDLQAQKALMVNEATLRTLPAPTGDERQAARSQLAIRNPQAYRMLVAEENARASQGRAAASKAQTAAQATAIQSIVAGNPARGGVVSEVAPEAAPQQEPRMPAFSAGTGEIAPTGPQPRGRNASRKKDISGYSLGSPGEDLDFGAAGRGVALPPQEAPSQVEVATGQYQEAFDQYNQTLDWARATREKAASLDPKTAKAVMAEVGKEVKRFEDMLKFRSEILTDVQSFQPDTVEPKDLTSTEEKIALLRKADPLLTEAEAINAVVRTRVIAHPDTGAPILVDTVNGNVIVSAEKMAEAQASIVAEEVAAVNADVASDESDDFDAAEESFGAGGWGKMVANSLADVAGVDMPFPDVAKTQQAFRVFGETMTKQMATAYSGRTPAFLLKSIKDLSPKVGEFWEGSGDAKIKLNSLDASLTRSLDMAERELSSRTNLTRADKSNLNNQILAIKSAKREVNAALKGFKKPAAAGSDAVDIMNRLLEEAGDE